MIRDTDRALLHSWPMEDAIAYWDDLEAWGRENNKLTAVVRALCLADLFYMMVRACGRVDMLHPWVYARVREVEANPDGHLDLWAREHNKSSTITFGLTIQDILRNPEITFGIFSHTRPIAKAFLRQIMREFESNAVLNNAFPDVLWGLESEGGGVRQSPKWNEDDGLIVRRKGNPKEATIEAWGLVDGQPTSKHYDVLLYDDIVVAASVTTPEMISKTMTALEQSYNLGVTPGGKRRFVGTRWHFSDAYATLKLRGTAIPREHPGKIGGTEDGDSVLWSESIHQQKRRDMGIYTYGAQILLNPKADALQGFKREWLNHYTLIPDSHARAMNKYILVDAANSKRRGSDYTSMWVVGLATDNNYYVLDMVRDRLSLTERGDRLFVLHRKWRPLAVRYERYGLQGDIEHFKDRMEKETYRFPIIEVGGQTPKVGRIGRLLPIFEQGRMYLPKSLHVADYQRVVRDLVHDFIEEEYMAFPVGGHDDMLDSLSRIAEPDLPLVWPAEKKVKIQTPSGSRVKNNNTAWMGS